MYLEIVTPDEKIFEVEVFSAIFPGTDGSFQVLNNHAPMISTLGLGDLRYTEEKKKEEVLSVDGGVVEVLNNKVVVLAEKIVS
ncbi:MAG: ATP synthase F1 subunit epsilon [Cyclobacteriaceae bacterium]